MAGNPELVEELRAQLEQVRARQAANDKLLGGVHAARTKLAELAASATSPDGMVTVVSGSGGIVRSVRLTRDALRTDADALSEVITATIRDATSRATRQQLEIVRSHLGGEVDPAHVLGPQAAFARAAETSPPAPRPAPDPGDDEASQNILARR